jgi:hypothetical protein
MDTLILNTTADIIFEFGIVTNRIRLYCGGVRAILRWEDSVSGTLSFSILSSCLSSSIIYLVVLPQAFHSRDSENKLYNQLAVELPVLFVTRTCIQEDKLRLDTTRSFDVLPSSDYTVFAMSSRCIYLTLLNPEATILTTVGNIGPECWCKKPHTSCVTHAWISPTFLSLFFNDTVPTTPVSLTCEGSPAVLSLYDQSVDMKRFRIGHCSNTQQSILVVDQTNVQLLPEETITEQSASCTRFNDTHLIQTVVYTGNWELFNHDPGIDIAVYGNTITTVSRNEKFHFSIDLLNSDTRLVEWQVIFCSEIEMLEDRQLEAWVTALVVLAITLPLLLYVIYCLYMYQRTKGYTRLSKNVI